MKKLIELIKNPSGFDSMANYAGSIPDEKWLVVLTRSRDSDVLTESNWEAALEQLGGENENSIEVFRFGHWACGWWEALCVSNEDSERLKIASEITESLENYPILDEDDYSEREINEANDVWSKCYSKKERVKYIRDHRGQFEFDNFKDMLCCVRGEYFAGYASELIN